MPLLSLSVVTFPSEKVPLRLSRVHPLSPYLKSRIRISTPDQRGTSTLFRGVERDNDVYVAAIYDENGAGSTSSENRVGTIAKVSTVVINDDDDDADDADDADAAADARTGGHADTVVVTVTGVRRFSIVRYLTQPDADAYGAMSDASVAAAAAATATATATATDASSSTSEYVHDSEMCDSVRRHSAVQWCLVRLLSEDVPDVIPRDVRDVSSTTGLPMFLIRRYDVRRRISVVRDVCDFRKDRNFYSNLFKGRFPFANSTDNNFDALFFTFWISSNLPLNVDTRQKLLNARNILDRVEMIWDIMEIDKLLLTNYGAKGGANGDSELNGMREKDNKALRCRSCNISVCVKGDIMSVPGAAGVCSAYVNPHGVVHQTLTVSHVNKNVVIEPGRQPTLADTWFPGYAWNISYCGNCLAHLGWRFTLVVRSEGVEGQMNEFWGMAGTALVESAGVGEAEEEEEEELSEDDDAMSEDEQTEEYEEYGEYGDGEEDTGDAGVD
jgi:hypothetical protein